MIEIADAAQWSQWYEEQRPGLGAELLDELESTIREALEHLETSAVVTETGAGEPIYRFRLARFSRYAVYIRVSGSEALVLAFEHSSREPGYWKDRAD
ncbi:MAG: type II toxin-antitoxin system RelE/ParE family toxin [Sandaracinaceae bacterium]|nr:MAG: type II toxin-antitoxin system RelE/ParE family toxin [Sandaracinaceae bacterium]